MISTTSETAPGATGQAESTVARYWLSRLEVPRGAHDAYGAHQLIWRAFDRVPGTPQPFRYRDETSAVAGERGRSRGARVLLVQSRDEPDWTSVSDVSAQKKSVVLRLTRGDRLHFRLRACPRKQDGIRTRGQPSRKIAIERDEDIMQWFERRMAGDMRLPAVGFAALQYSFARPEKVVTQASAGEAFAVSLVQFDGLLQVIDAQRVSEVLVTGIGPGAAFGAGLLSVRP